jgi:hypothetical protein
MLAAFAAQQDWDGIYTFTFTNDAKSWKGDKINGFFDQSGNPAKHGLIPTAALIFRKGLVAPLEAHSTLSMTTGDAFEDFTKTNADIWGSARRAWKKAGVDPSECFTNVLGFTIADKVNPEGLQRRSEPALPASWQPEKSRFAINGRAVRGVAGKISGKNELGSVTFDVAELEGIGNGVVTLVSMDQKAIEESKTMLLTVIRRAENAGMQWNAARNSVGKNWGSGPAKVLGLTAEITLPGSPVTVTRLTADGTPNSESSNAAVNKFRVQPADGTMWYWLTRK